jgi:hypothetical protein
MDQSPAVQRFILFTVELNDETLSDPTLVRLTELLLIEVAESVKPLISRGLIAFAERHGEICYFPVGFFSMTANHKAWLDDYCSRPEQVEEWDNGAMTFVSCGIVILSVLVTDSHDARYLARLTTIPKSFVTLVLEMMDRLDLWSSYGVGGLNQTFENEVFDFDEVDNALHSATEEFWNELPSPDLIAELNIRRAGQRYGGKQDPELNNSFARDPFRVL